jgi:hypothetical protein
MLGQPICHILNTPGASKGNIVHISLLAIPSGLAFASLILAQSLPHGAYFTGTTTRRLPPATHIIDSVVQ